MKTSLFAFLSGLAFVPCSAAPYVLTDLGTLGGDAAATGINDRGVVCGYAYTGVGGLFPPNKCHFYYYTKSAGAFFPTIPGGDDAVANAIDPSGDVIAGYLIKAGNSNRSAFVYTRSTGVLTDLGQAGPAPALDSEAKGVTVSAVYGRVVVGYDYPAPASTSTQAAQWLGAGGTRTGFGGFTRQANGVNAAGTLVGQMKLSDSNIRGYYQRQGDFVNTLPTLGGFAATATAINDSEQVCGWGYLPGDGLTHAFLAKIGTSTIIDLAAGGPFAAFNSQATAINRFGHVVGWYEDANDGRRAFLYKDGKMIDLNTLLPAGTGMVLTEANGINRIGQIVGKGIKGGLPHSFILTPPPSFSIAGKKTIVVPKLKRTITIAGTGSITVSEVLYRVGNRGKFKKARGTTRWRFTAAIPPGNSVITVFAKGPGGSSKPTKIRIRRR